MSHMQKKKTGAALVLLLGMLMTLCACDRTISPPVPMEAEALSYDATLYYGRNGRIRLLYDKDYDMLSTYEGNDFISLYAAGEYSLAVSYTEGNVDLQEAKTAVESEFTSSGMTIAESKKKVSFSGMTFEKIEISSDEGFGAVCIGNTETGYAEIYYIFDPGASAEVQAHVEELLSTLRFGEYDGTEDTEDDYTKIYAQ